MVCSLFGTFQEWGSSVGCRNRHGECLMRKRERGSYVTTFAVRIDTLTIRYNNMYRNEKIEHRGCGLWEEICGLFEKCNQIEWFGKQSANRTCVGVRVVFGSLTHLSLSHSPTHPLTHSLTHSPTHSLCVLFWQFCALFILRLLWGIITVWVEFHRWVGTV